MQRRNLLDFVLDRAGFFDDPIEMPALELHFVTLEESFVQILTVRRQLEMVKML